MTFRDADGNTLSKAELTALTTQEPAQDPDRVFTEPIYETYENPGEGDRFESGKRLKFRAGYRISQRDFDAMFTAATVTSITPANGPAAGGTAFEVKGTDLAGVEGVDFDGVAATNVVVVDSETVRGTTPAGAAGAADVVVKDDAGNVTKTAFFTYDA